jgi:hypothetical protein
MYPWSPAVELSPAERMVSLRLQRRYWSSFWPSWVPWRGVLTFHGFLGCWPLKHKKYLRGPPTWPPSWWRARGEPEERPGGPRVSIWGVPPNCLIEPLVVLVCLLAFPCGTLILVRLITCSRQRIYYTSYFLCRRQRIQESW